MRRIFCLLLAAVWLLSACGKAENRTYLYDQTSLHSDLREAQWVLTGTVTELLGEYKPDDSPVGETYFVPAVIAVDRVFADRTGTLGGTITVRQTCHTGYVSPEPLPHLAVGEQYFFCLYLAPDGETVIIGGSAAQISEDGVPMGMLERYKECYAPYETTEALYQAVENWLALPAADEPAWEPAEADMPWSEKHTALYEYPVMTEWEAMKKLYETDGCRSVSGGVFPADDFDAGVYTGAELICRSGFPYWRFVYADGSIYYTPAIYPEYLG